ncbi:MAG: hypothetical protein QUU85_06355 [Candidatus Eisenbacteria bacterium]|nr:hypothetical protein [Candidatus Eisenbacteria bacterium]
MRTPTVDMNPETLLIDFGYYHLRMLEKHPEHADLHEKFQRVQDYLQGVYDEHHVMEIRVDVLHEALHEASNNMLDDVRRFEKDLRKHVNGDRDCDEYRKYFPVDATPLSKLNPPARLRRVIEIAETLSEDEDVLLRAHEMLLGMAIEWLQGDIDEWAKAAKTEEADRPRVRAAKVRWLGAYRRSYVELQKRYHGQPGEAERFFWKAPKPGNGGGPVDWDDPIEEEVLRPIEPPIDLGGPVP